MQARAWFAIIALGRDRPGIVADLSGCVFECGYNLEDASMTQLGDEFAVLMLISGRDPSGHPDHRQLRESLKRLEWEKRLTVFLRALDGEPEPHRSARGEPYTVTASGVDRAGIVAGVSGCLAEAGVDIRDLRGSVSEAPQSGTPVYTLIIRASVTPAVDLQELEKRLQLVGNRLDIEVSVRAGD